MRPPPPPAPNHPQQPPPPPPPPQSPCTQTQIDIRVMQVENCGPVISQQLNTHTHVARERERESYRIGLKYDTPPTSLAIYILCINQVSPNILFPDEQHFVRLKV